jgi:cytochrome bd-type quinol oxidase subunit 2
MTDSVTIMTVVAGIFVPLVLGYQAWSRRLPSPTSAESRDRRNSWTILTE